MASADDLDSRIAARLRTLRLHQDLSLSALASLSGVSKAMISKVERGDSSPSAAILGRLAAGLGVSLAQLLVEPAAEPKRLRRRAEQPVWREPTIGYTRRQVAERDPRTGIEMVEVTMPRGARVDYPRWSGEPYRQRLWLLDGSLHLAYGEESFELQAGDCLDFGVDRPLSFRTAGTRACRYLLVISAS